MSVSLRAAQEWFLELTTHAGDLEAGITVASRVHGFGGRAELEGMVTRGPELSAPERLGIYHESYRARLVECLADDYPALRFALGHEHFETLALDYVARHPSQARTLNAYGQHMAGFCRSADFASADFTQARFLGELAELEWALVEAIHAPLRLALAPERLAEISTRELASACLVPQPSLGVLRFDFPIGDYYRAWKEERDPDVPERAPAAVAVLRRDFTVWRYDLEPAAANVLHALGSGQALEQALAGLPRGFDGKDVTRWFERWMAEGFFVDFDQRWPSSAARNSS